MKWTSENAGAFFSPCREYRYTLWREFDTDAAYRTIAFIGLNPSTADEFTDDNTVRRCWKFAQRWGFSKFFMLNLFGYRATDPKDMKAREEPTGPWNFQCVINVVNAVDLAVLAWGVHGTYLKQDEVMLDALSMFDRKLYCLGRTKDGHPRHPLYVPNATKLEKW